MINEIIAKKGEFKYLVFEVQTLTEIITVAATEN